MPSRMWKKPSFTNRSAAWCQRGSSRTMPRIARQLERPFDAVGRRKRSVVTTRMPSRARAGLDREVATDPTRSRTRTARRAGPGSRRASCRAASRGPVTCASAASYEANDRSDGSETCVATIRGAPRRVPPSYSAMLSEIQSVAASRTAGSARARSRLVASRVGKTHVAHRGERHAHQQAQPLSLGPQERVDRDVVRDLVRARRRAAARARAPRAPAARGGGPSFGGRSPLRAVYTGALFCAEDRCSIECLAEARF